jgi:hypothetical protein
MRPRTQLSRTSNQTNRSTNTEGQMAKQAAAKRERINTGTDKRYVRRNPKAQFKESDDVGRSLAQDRKRKATAKAKKGRGDRGDR